MPRANSTPSVSASSAGPDKDLIRELVEKEIDRRMHVYRNIATAFLVGLGGFVVSLVGVDPIKDLVRDQLLAFGKQRDEIVSMVRSEHAALQHAVDQLRSDMDSKITSIDNKDQIYITDRLRKSVAYTYGDQFTFVYEPSKPIARSIPFFARKDQRLSMYLSIKHYGTGDPLEVSIQLDKSVQIWRSSDELDFTLMNLTDKFISSPSDSDVHFLDISIKAPAQATNDAAFVRVLLNISGSVEVVQ